MNNSVGGTVFVGRGLLGSKVWQSEQYWDGKVPFRITSEQYSDGTNANGTFDFQNYNDFLLEDGSRTRSQVRIKLTVTRVLLMKTATM